MASTEGSTLRGSLRAAREALSKREFKDAIREARTALKHDKRSYDAFLYIGKAAFFLEEYAQADVAYRKAVELNAAGLPAWQGLAELHGSTGDHEHLADACRHLVEGWSAAGQADKATLFRRKLAQALLDQGKREEARKVWAQVIKAPKQDVAQRIEALCALVDIEIADHAEMVEREVQQRSSRHKKLAKAAAKAGGGASGSAAADPGEIQREVEAESAPALETLLGMLVDETAPTPHYAKYHVLNLQRALAKLRHVPEANSVAAKDVVLARSLRMIAGQASTPDPFLVALALCEEDACADLAAWTDEAAGWLAVGDTPPVRDQLFVRLGKRLGHAFPSEGLGWVAVAAELYARQQDSRHPDLDRVKAACQLGLRLNNQSPYGWHLLGTVQLAAASASGAMQCVQRGLEAVASLRERYGFGLRRAEFRLRILESRALIDSGRTEEAAAALSAIEDESEEQLGEVDAGEVRLAALEGQARAATCAATDESGAALARVALERLLREDSGSAWAYAQLGALALRWADGGAEVDEARRNYEKSVQLEPGNAVFHFELGEIYWQLGGKYKLDRQYAHAQFLEAARLDPGTARAFTFLGRFYHDVQGDALRGRRCFQKAVQLDPDDDGAGTALADMMASSGQRRAEVAMCRDACARSPRAYWAWRRMGFLEARAGRWQEALVSLQHALRGQRNDGAAWEALALAYQRLGKLTAALKAYGQAEKLGKADERVPTFALLQAANIHVSLSNFRMASDKYQAVLKHVPTHAAALAGQASALFGQARRFQQQGAAQAAADLLADARGHAESGATLHGNTRPLWKLVGDINLELALVAPPTAAQPSPPVAGGSGKTLLQRIEAGRQVRVDAFGRSERGYRHAVHLNPGDASGWADLGACVKHHADFAHPVQEGTQKALHWGWRVRAAKQGSATGAPLADQGLLLRTLAERLVLGALALEPGAAAHWATAGVVAQERSRQQHALIRALQIDPKLSAAWVNLGQLYLGESDFPLARAAFDHARSCDPVLAVPWASMAFMDAAEAHDLKHREEALSTARHAVQMGPTPEGQLGLGGLAAALGQLDSPDVHIALRKAAVQMPGVAAVHNLLGLANETRGLVPQAVESFENARAVLEARGGTAKETESVALNLARVLAKAGRHADAVEEYEKLRDQGAVLLETSAAAWRLYGLSLWRTGQSESATAALFQALQLAPPPLPDAPPPREHTAALCALAWIQFQAAGPKLALQTLRESVPDCWRDPRVGLTGLAVGALACDNAAIAFAISRCPALFDHDLAPRTHRMLSIAHRLQNNCPRSLHHLRTALHSHPDSPVLRAALSEALRLAQRHEQARRVVQGASRPAAGGLSNAEAVDHLGTCVREAAESVLALGWAPERAADTQVLLRDLQRWIKIAPAAKHTHALLALLVALRAQGSPGNQSLRWGVVRRLCRTAVEAEGWEEGGRGAGSARVDLQLLEAEALSHSRAVPEREVGRQQAMHVVASTRGQQRDLGRAHAQVGRCCTAVGDMRSAVAHFHSATTSGDSIHDYLAYAAAQAAGSAYEDALHTLQAAEYTAVKAGSEQRRWITAVHVARAHILLQSGDPGAAAAVASDAVAEEPDNPLLLLLQGALLSLTAESGSAGETAAAIRRALSRAVHLLRARGVANSWAHYLLGQAEVEGGGGRKGREKWESSMRTAAQQWPHLGQPAELLYALAEVAATSDKHGGSGLCPFGPEGLPLRCEQWSRRAVHVQPSCSTYWDTLRH